MIQRIQTLWLFLASLISALLLTDWYTGYVYKADVPQGFGAVVKYLRVTNHFPSLLLAVAMIVLPFIAIFFFKNRKRQRSLGVFSIVLCIAFISLSMMHIANFSNGTPPPQNGSYQAGMVIPVIALVFIILAIGGIRKDEKLVKSMDRLR